MQLHEKYRPKTFSDVLGQPDAIKTMQRLIERGGLSGRSLLITGQSGTGKTTLARIAAAEVADEFFIEEIDSTDLTVARLKAIEQDMSLSAWGKGGRAYIVNEAHGLRKEVVTQLLVTLERLPSHVLIVFTTTVDGQMKLDGMDDAAPFRSRSICIELARRDLAKAFAERAEQIAIAENLAGKPAQAYLKLVQEHRNNFRAVLCAIESGAMCA